MRHPPPGYERLPNAVLIEQAKQHARTLRREAVPTLWNGLDAACAKAARSFTRFVHRLARHRPLKAQSHQDLHPTQGM
ncbi:hypothetical protein [Limnohabitans sp.]|jgi:hypothetical protein|uniref:hypothetical protein n=1 Tax=Limnohabitans sp. TaxID=1907725 RepID=UPI00286F8BC9|nr:hypothetical protein [Limnohabitans sp.]